jgi:hypothetical protein
VANEHDLPHDEYHRAGVEIINGTRRSTRCSSRVGTRLRSRIPSALRLAGGVRSLRHRPRRRQLPPDFRDGRGVAVENVSTVITNDLAYILEIERYRARVGGDCIEDDHADQRECEDRERVRRPPGKAVAVAVRSKPPRPGTTTVNRTLRRVRLTLELLRPRLGWSS